MKQRAPVISFNAYRERRAKAERDKTHRDELPSKPSLPSLPLAGHESGSKAGEGAGSRSGQWSDEAGRT